MKYKQLESDRSKIEDVLRGTQSLLSELYYSGVSLLDQTTLRKIDIVFQQAVKVNHSRLVINLRYIRVEMQRFISDPHQFSTERLIFFCNQAFLLK